jgi:hypothetical protein
LESPSEQPDAVQPDTVTATDAETAGTESSQLDGGDKQQTDQPLDEKVEPDDSNEDQQAHPDEENDNPTTEEGDDENAAAKSAYSFCGYALAFK